MKRLFWILYALFAISIVGYARTEKVVEKSAKKAPQWIGTVNADFFSVSATAPTLEDAKDRCLSDIQQYITNSVAVNITSVENSEQSLYSVDDVSHVMTKYSSQVKAQSTYLPFIAGISLSNAEEVYWERRYVKEDKLYYYVYHVYYPFSARERAIAVQEFKDMDASYENKLIELEKNFNEFTNLDYVREAIASLNGLMGYFFDNARATRAKALHKSYRDCYSHVVIKEGPQAHKQITYTLSLNGRQVTSTTVPVVRSNYADNLRVTNQDGTYVVEFEPLVIPGEEHTIEVSYMWEGRTVSQKILFNPNL